jgi:hypothetical protein
MHVISQLAKASQFGAWVPDLRQRTLTLGERLRAHHRGEIEAVKEALIALGRPAVPDVQKLTELHASQHEALQRALDAAADIRLADHTRAVSVLAALDDVTFHEHEEDRTFLSLPEDTE